MQGELGMYDICPEDSMNVETKIFCRCRGTQATLCVTWRRWTGATTGRSDLGERSEINNEKKDKTYTQRPVSGALDKKSGHLYGGLGGHRRQPWKQGPAKVPLGSACTQENFLVNTFPTKTIPSKYPSLQENPL